jgi:D-amino-acid oxidase
MRREAEILVIGAGVIGLTTAVRVAEQGVRVRVRTALPPEQTTSRVAGAIWASSLGEPAADVRRWASEGLREFRALAQASDTGVRIARGRLASRLSADPPSPARFPGVKIHAGDRAPQGFLAASTVELPLIDMRRYLGHLAERLADAGVGVEVRPVGSLAEVIEQAPTIVNCAGIGARELVSDPALRPVRGEHVIVENPGVEEFFVEEPRGDEWTSLFPHGERIVLGGNAREDDWSLEPDAPSAQGILDRCALVEPALNAARVIEHQVGLRPARARIRLECDQLGSTTLIHNYGHGASGVSLSWGCAKDVAVLAVDRAPSGPREHGENTEAV